MGCAPLHLSLNYLLIRKRLINKNPKLSTTQTEPQTPPAIQIVPNVVNQSATNNEYELAAITPILGIGHNKSRPP